MRTRELKGLKRQTKVRHAIVGAVGVGDELRVLYLPRSVCVKGCNFDTDVAWN
jgi:hypothetical protein